MNNDYSFIWQSGLLIISCLVLFVIGKMAFQMFNSKVDVNYQLTEKDNLAFHVSYIGYYAGIIAAISGIMLSHSHHEFWTDLVYISIYGIVSVLVLNISSKTYDKIVFPRIELSNEISDKSNLCAAVLQGAQYLSVGVILGGVLLTEVEKPFEALLFLLLALVILVGGMYYYDIITPYKVKDKISEGNLAVAFGLAGAKISFALLIYSGFQITHGDWVDSLKSIGMDVGIGIVILPIIRYVVDKIFLVNHSLSDEIVNQEKPNLGAGLFEGMAYIGASLLIIWCWHL